MDTSALIRLPDDCTVGYIVECKLGGHLQPSPLFHSHLETLQLLRAAQLPEQVSTGGGVRVGSSLLMGKLRSRVTKDPPLGHTVARRSPPLILKSWHM